MLTPGSRLNAGDDRKTVRLSYVFEDDDGSWTGITSSWLRPDPHGTIESFRPDVLHGDRAVGILNPPRESAYLRYGTQPERSAFGSGILITSFMLAHDIELSDQFRLVTNGSIEPMAAITSDEVHILGEGPVGTIPDNLENIPIRGGIVYPLLSLRRSPADLSKINAGIRNGAMVTTRDGALVGIIVGISRDGRGYHIAPITDVLEWHRLWFMRPVEEVTASNASAARASTPSVPLLPEGLDQRYRTLVDV